MSELKTENADKKAQDVVRDLRLALVPLVERLTPAIEPAIVYAPKPEAAS